MHYSGREFTIMLGKMENKKKIEEDVLKMIEESNQKEFSSLYDVYKDNPNKVNANERNKSNQAYQS
jgi:ferric iron reductase protein FhuF